MITDLGGVTDRLVGMALDASQLRQEAIATNIANANSANYVPLRVNFERQLALASHSLVDRSQDASSMQELAHIAPQIREAAPGPGGVPAKVQLDQEVARMMQNVIHYEALLAGLSKRTSIIKMAINEGRP